MNPPTNQDVKTVDDIINVLVCENGAMLMVDRIIHPSVDQAKQAISAMRKITNEFAGKVAAMEDSAVYAYLKGSIELLELTGQDITQFALIRVANPMEYKKDSITVSSQYRIVPIETLENVPVYED